MPTQSIHEVESNIGVLTIVQSVRTNRPEGLRKPYEYILPKSYADALYKTMRLFLSKKSKEKDKFQIVFASKKSLAYGMKFELFVLAFAPGLTGNPNYGVSIEEWQETTNKVQELLTVSLGPDAELYKEPYSFEDKFQARFECYIAFDELL